MTKVEKQFRKYFKHKYFEYLEIRECSEEYDKYVHRLWCELLTVEEIAEKLFPNINVELCETKWRHEYRKESEI